MTIKSKPATAEYRDGYDRIFSKRHHPLCNYQNPQKPKYGVEDCPMCAGLEKEFEGCKNEAEMIAQVGRYHISRFQRATIKMEGGVCDPDECEWDFGDPIELATYKDQKARFDSEQDRLYGVTK